MKLLTYAGLVLLLVFAVGIGACAAMKIKTDALYPYEEFRSALQSALTERGADPDRQTFHFVVLMDTTRTDGPAAQWVRNICYGLLTRYLVAGEETSDIVSFVPFQLDVRQDYSVWNQRFAPSNVPDIENKVPTRPANKPGVVGGHDIEAALLVALDTVRPTQSAVFVVISDSEVSEPPSSPSEYLLTHTKQSFEDDLRRRDIVLVRKSPLTGTAHNAEGQEIGVNVYYRIYLPDNFAPLGTLAAKTRSEIVADQNLPLPTQNGRDPTTPNSRKTTTSKTDEPTEVPWWVWLIAVLLVIVVLLAFYAQWLFKPRHVQIGHSSGTARFGRDTKVGGQGLDKNAIELADVADGKCLATLQVTMFGQVIMRGYGSYSLTTGFEEGPISLEVDLKVISIKDNVTQRFVRQLQACVTR